MTRHRTAFSLVELSIVLVILGLLVGGILAGQSLIRASELRAVGTESARYQTSISAFRDKYFALPGDMANATSIWGKDATTPTYSCASAAGNAGTPGTCNGNANSLIGNGSSANEEGMRAWQQLSLSGLVEGTFTGYYDTGPKLTIGVNVPRSKLTNAGWVLLSRAASASVWDKTGNFLQLGSEGLGELWLGSMSGEDAWNIDKKLDDGMPEYGRLIGDTGSTGSVGACTNPNVGSYTTPPANREYNLGALTAGRSACRMWFRL